MHVRIWCTFPHPASMDRRGPNQIKNQKSGNQLEFWFWLIRNRNDLSKFRFRSIRNRIEKLKIWFRLIRTEILLRKSGCGSAFLKPHFGRPLNTGVVSVSVKIYLSVYCYALMRCGLSIGTVPVNNLFHFETMIFAHCTTRPFVSDQRVSHEKFFRIGNVTNTFVQLKLQQAWDETRLISILATPIKLCCFHCYIPFWIKNF